MPYVDESVLVGGFYSQSVGVVDSLRAGTLMREEAQERGRAHRVGEHRGARHRHRGRPRQARAHRPRRRGGGVRRHRLRRVEPAARARWPARRSRSRPAVHQMIDVGPVPRFETSKSAIEFPIVRDMDTNMYERQDGQRPRGRLVRAPADPARPRGDPLDRGVGDHPDRAALHAGRLRPADGGRARAGAGDPGRRVGGHQVRDQRAPVAHARTACRSSARPRRCAASGRPPRCG